MKKIAFSLILLSLSTSFLLKGQDKSIAKAMKGFDDFAEKVMSDHHVPGMAVCIVKDGKLVFAKGYGYSDIENKTPVDQNTLFAIGSSSKAFTAFGVMKLASEGKLDADKPLKEYLPDFDLSDDYIEDRLTPRDLLCHRSGLPRHDLVWYGSSKSRDDLFHSLSHLEFSAGLRERWQYQNLMFMTAGVLIEEVSGKTWEEYTEEEIFKPLGMERSNFSVEEIQNDDNRALPYAWADSSMIKLDYRNIDAIGPAGSINSSVVEMAEWLKLQLNKGIYENDTLMGQGIFNQMHSPQMAMGGVMDDNNVFHNSYGLGWFISSYRGHKRVEHGGNIDGFSANVGMLPLDNIGVVVLSNLNGNPSLSVIRNNIFDRLLGLKPIDWNGQLLERMSQASSGPQAEDKPVEGTRPSHDLEDYAGDYEHVNYGDLNISIEDENLVATYNSLVLPLNHFHYDVFQWDDRMLGKNKIQFHMNMDGEIETLTVILDGNVEAIEFKKVFKQELTEELLSSYTGTYTIGQMSLRIYLNEAGELKMSVPGQPEYLLEPMSATKFKPSGLEGFSVEFEGDEIILNQPNGVFRAQKQ